MWRARASWGPDWRRRSNPRACILQRPAGHNCVHGAGATPRSSCAPPQKAPPRPEPPIPCLSPLPGSCDAPAASACTPAVPLLAIGRARSPGRNLDARRAPGPPRPPMACAPRLPDTCSLTPCARPPSACHPQPHKVPKLACTPPCLFAGAAVRVCIYSVPLSPWFDGVAAPVFC